MKYLLRISALSVLAIAGAFVLVSVNPSVTTAHEGEDHGEEIAQTDEQPEEESDEETSRFTYTAQRGDSFTKIARKSIQTYGYYEEVDLSLAEIVAAETFLTSDAGFPAINEGQEVSITEEAVKAAVEKAQALDDEAEANWEYYVQFVDFNTDAVGESSE